MSTSGFQSAQTNFLPLNTANGLGACISGQRLIRFPRQFWDGNATIQRGLVGKQEGTGANQWRDVGRIANVQVGERWLRQQLRVFHEGGVHGAERIRGVNVLLQRGRRSRDDRPGVPLLVEISTPLSSASQTRRPSRSCP